MLLELVVAEALLDRRAALDRGDGEQGALQGAYPVLVGRQVWLFQSFFTTFPTF